MDKELKECIKKYKFLKDIKRFSFGIDNNHFYRTIESKEYVIDYQNRAFGAFDVIKNNYPLHKDDIEYVEKAIVKYEVCISKCISMNDIILPMSLEDSLKWKVSSEELESFIEKLFELYDLYEKLVQKKLFQD